MFSIKKDFAGFPKALAVIYACLLTGAASAASEAPKVSASILPIHSLAAWVMQGVAQPVLLISPGASPHHYNLRPSESRAIAESDIIFWVSEGFEAYLKKPVQNSRARSVPLSNAQGVELRKAREGGVWEGHGHDEHHQGHSHGHDDRHGAGEAATASHDQHIWLDPANARAMLREIVRVLAETDSVNAALYRQNGKDLEEKLHQLEKRISMQLEPVRRVPFIVFHDAYQYFERRFGLVAAGSLLVHTGEKPGARRMLEIRKKILTQRVVCVFREPQFDGKLAASVIRGTDARVAELDPIGQSIEPGPEAYGTLIETLANNLRDCLTADSGK